MFVRKCKANVKILKRQVAELEDEKVCVERYIADPNRQGEESKEQKVAWLSKADEFIRIANRFVQHVESGNAEDDGGHETKQKCAFRLCLEPKSPYQLSKEAKQYCKAIAELVQEARGFKDITLSYRQEKEAVNVFEDLESRKHVLNNILEALKSPSTNPIGVYGAQGTGKTMLLREVERKAEEQKLFDAVVMATVSRNAADLPRIQDEIQHALCPDRVSVSNELTTHQENAEASNLIKARRAEKEVLVILDNIWEPELYSKLHDRLPSIDKEDSLLSYKILLSSTDRAVLSDLSEEQFEIHPLEGQEPLKLFKRIVGDLTESRSLPSMIAGKMWKLPVSVATVANALKSSKQINWKTVIRALKRSNPEDQLQSSFKISYGCLSKQRQQTFLLCSLMDHNAAIQDLLKYGIGLGLYPRVNSVKEARDEVLNSVAKLRDSFFLLDSSSNLHFNMPDLFRHFAKSFASTEVGLNNWLVQAKEGVKWIYLSNGDTPQLPNELNCPQLTFFHLSKEDPSSPIPPDLFTGTRGLRVLGLTKTWSMPQSISLLNNLHTLRLDQSALRDVDVGAIIGKLKNLLVLSLVGCDIEALPEQIGQLAELKLLDLSDCTELKVIPSGVLSGLFRLEELYMRNSFNQWAGGVNWDENKNASLSELKHLKLTAIEVQINVCNIQMIKEDLFFENLARYKIFVGDMWHS